MNRVGYRWINKGTRTLVHRELLTGVPTTPSRLVSELNKGCTRNVVIDGTLPRNGKGVEVSQYAEVTRQFTAKDVLQYANLVGDSNPIHQAIEKQDDNIKNPPIVHGMLVASLFSCIFGTLIPGSIYREQDLEFCAPVYMNDFLVGRVQVTKVRELRGGKGLVVTCDTNVLKEQELCIKGSATVWLPSGEKATENPR